MGFGDDILITGIVKRAYEKVKKPLVVGNGRPEWSEVFENNPKISRETYPGCVWVREGVGNRPYIDYPRCTSTRMAWKSFRLEPGELYLTSEEKDWPHRNFVYIEPNVKQGMYPNKDWGFDNWQKVVDALPDIRFVQGRGKSLRGVEQVGTESFRHACGLLLHADLFVGTDGGLHHAAAALGKRAVIVWGGLISPLITGYSSHKILCKAQTFCGSLIQCDHCKEALESIKVNDVVDAIHSQIRSGETALQL